MIGVQDRDQEVVRLYQSGMTLRAVAEQTGLSHEGVRLAVMRNGVEIRGKPKKATAETSMQDRDELIADLYGKGQSLRQIAVAVSMDHSGVRLALKRMGVEMRGHAPGERRKKTTPEAEAEIVQLYARGHSIKSVGGMVSPPVSDDTVRRVLKAAGIPTGRPGPKPSVRETPPPKTPVIVQGDAFRAREDRFVTLRRKGLSSHQAATEMDLTEGQRDFLERMFRAQSHMANKPDTSSPKFAHDAKHVSALIEAGGFAHLSERRLPSGVVVVSLPLVPFKPEACA